MKPATTTGLVLLVVHSIITVSIYINVEINMDVAQAGFVWFYLGFNVFADVLPGLHGNLRALVYIGVLGGLQWFLIGILVASLLRKILSLFRNTAYR